MMTEVEKLLAECSDICKIVDKKTFSSKANTAELIDELLRFSLFITLRPNDKQKRYIKAITGTKSDLRPIFSEHTQMNYINENHTVINNFITTDVCFSSSDYTYNGKKTERLEALFQAYGKELVKLGDDSFDKVRAESFITLFIQRIEADKLLKTTDAMNHKLLGNNSNNNNDFISGNNNPETSISNMQPEEVINVEEDTRTLEELIQELNDLTGLKSVKKELNSLIHLVKISNMRKEKGMKVPSISKHMVFTGNPGTGKTTVARLLAGIYHKLGVLTKGQLVETDRAALVAGYVGQTAIKTEQVITKAMGGVLFIDEAYTLSANKGEGDFGQEAIDTLLKIMEDNRDDLVVIVAGYPDLMEEFLTSNPGLKSRFNKFIGFEDYTETELLDIFTSMCEKQEYEFSDETKEALVKKIKSIIDLNDESFANARTMRNMMEFTILNQADRLVALSEAAGDNKTSDDTKEVNSENESIENEDNVEVVSVKTDTSNNYEISEEDLRTILEEDFKDYILN